MSTAPSSVFATARKMMVDSQLRPNKVTDNRLISAFGTLPREEFLPAALAARAYSDENIRLGRGRVLLAPMGMARLFQEADVAAGARVLLVGAGLGYGAAILATTGAQITALESDATLLASARQTLPKFAPDVTLVGGNLADGWPEAAPYDRIIIEGGAEQLPGAVAAQLAEHGRIVMVKDRGPRIGVAVVGVKSGKGVSFATRFDCVASVLPGFEQEKAFVF